MIIKDKRKDYYDYLAHTLGIDSTIVFDRQSRINISEFRYCPDKTVVNFNNILKNINGMSDIIRLSRKWSNGISELEWEKNRKVNFVRKLMDAPVEYRNTGLFSYLGRLYPIVQTTTSEATRKMMLLSHSEIRELMLAVHTKEWDYLMDIDKIVSYLDISQNDINEDLYKIHMELKMPYFICNSGGYGNVIPDMNTIPLLSDIKGFIELYPADVVYKDITNFFVEINSIEEKDNPKPLKDLDKIHKAGFDTKVSFRKRKDNG